LVSVGNSWRRRFVIHKIVKYSRLVTSCFQHKKVGNSFCIHVLCALANISTHVVYKLWQQQLAINVNALNKVATTCSQ
jgi:hypothetical protein